MTGKRRAATVIFVVVALWAIGLAVWAARPLHDSVPVGIDQTLTTPRLVSQDVDCNSLFAGSPRPDEPLPALTVQPEGAQPLAFQRTPCVLVQDQARVLFVVNAVMALGAAAGGATLLRRRRKTRVPVVAPVPA